MRKLIILLFLFLLVKGEAQRLFLGVHNTGSNVWNDELFTAGTYYPSTTRTAQVEKYEQFKYGWLLCYGMNEFAGYYWSQTKNASYNPLPATAWNVENVNVAAWADSASAHGVDYAVLTVVNEFGFALWPSQADHKMSNITLGSGSGQISPYRSHPYNVAAVPSADQQIVDKFANEFRGRGIEPIPYVCLFTEFNIIDGTINEAHIPGGRLSEYVNFKSRQIQELLVKYHFNYIWLDYAGPMPQWTCQAFYNAVKAINPNCVVIGNAIGETNFAHFPYDIGSIEEYAVYGGNTSYRLTTQSYGGTTYYCPREIVATPYGTYSQWYDYDDSVLVQPPYTKLVTQTVSQFQGIVNEAKTYNKPFLAAMLVKKDGTLQQHTLNFLRQINFSRP